MKTNSCKRQWMSNLRHVTLSLRRIAATLFCRLSHRLFPLCTISLSRQEESVRFSRARRRYCLLMSSSWVRHSWTWRWNACDQKDTHTQFWMWHMFMHYFTCNIKIWRCMRIKKPQTVVPQMAHKICKPVSVLKWEEKCKKSKLIDKWALHFTSLTKIILPKKHKHCRSQWPRPDSHLAGMCTCRVIDCSSWTDQRRRVWATWHSFLFFLFPLHSGLCVQIYFTDMGNFKKITACTYKNITLHSTVSFFLSYILCY